MVPRGTNGEQTFLKPASGGLARGRSPGCTSCFLELDGSGASPSTQASWQDELDGDSPSSCCAPAPTFIESAPPSSARGASTQGTRGGSTLAPSPGGLRVLRRRRRGAAGALARRAATHRAARTSCARRAGGCAAWWACGGGATAPCIGLGVGAFAERAGGSRAATGGRFCGVAAVMFAQRR